MKLTNYNVLSLKVRFPTLRNYIDALHINKEHENMLDFIFAIETTDYALDRRINA